MSDSNLERIEKELDVFMECAADDRGTITRSGWLLFAEYMQQKAIKERDEALAELEQYKRDAGRIRPVIAMVLNALDRDADSGMKSRAEMAEELRAALNQQQAEGY